MRTLSIIALLLAAAPVGAQTHDHAGTHAMPPVLSPEMPTEQGQAGFAAIAEIVAILEADANTDWSRVDIEALRLHLIDMHEVTLNAAVTSKQIENGWRFSVSGNGRTRDAIRRMILAHAASMGASGSWRYEASQTSEGAVMTVRAADAAEVARIGALGFIGVMTAGMHHQQHHLFIARGEHPHR